MLAILILLTVSIALSIMHGWGPLKLVLVLSNNPVWLGKRPESTRRKSPLT